MEQQRSTRSTVSRIGRIIVKTVLFIFLFIVLIVALVLTPPVQNMLRTKAVSYLEHTLKTKVSIGKIYIGLPKKVIIENVYLEDRQKDTLLTAGSLKADIALFKLIKGEVDINSIELKNSTVKIKRQFPDTIFNFQFIIDEFSPAGSAKNTSADTSASKIAIRNVTLDKIRLVFKDVVTGNDAEAWLNHLETRIDLIDAEHSVFDIPDATIDGLTARVYQSKPLATPEPVSKDVAEATKPAVFNLDLHKISLRHLQFDYRNDVSALYSTIKLNSSDIVVNKLDMANMLIDLDKLSVDNIIANIHLGKKEQAKVVVKEAAKEVETRAEAGWRVLAKEIRLTNNQLKFDNDNLPVQKHGIDYAHLAADSLTLHADNFLLSLDSIGGEITKAEVREKSGFILKEFRTKFLYSGTETFLQDLYVKTPGTEIKKDVAFRYASLDALQNDIGNVYLDADIENSKIRVGDILYFAPFLSQQPAFANASTTWYINSRVKGRISDLRIEELQLQGLKDTRVDISGRLAGLPEMKNAVADLTVRRISTSKRDMALFMPAGALPKNITIPDQISVSGRAKGNMAGMNADLALRTNLGTAFVKGTFKDFSDTRKIQYNATIQTAALDLGTILQQKQNLGPLTSSFTISGKGADPKTAKASLKGKINSIVLKQYNYRDVALSGSLVNQKATFTTSIVDPNIHVSLAGEADISKEFPAVSIDAMIDSLKLQPLHLAPATTIYRAKIKGNFPTTDPDNLQGNLLITQSLLIREDQRLQLDTIRLLAGKNDAGQFIRLNSDMVNAELKGRYKLTELVYVFQNSIQSYFAVQPPTSVKKVQPYNFQLDAFVFNSPAIKSLIPGFERLDSIQFQSHFSDTNGWTASLNAPVIDMGVNHVRMLTMQAGTVDNKIKATVGLGHFVSGSSIELNNTTLNAILANNQLDFALNIKDRGLKDKYNVGGTLRKQNDNNYTLSLRPDSLLLNYQAWSISPNNKLIIAGTKFNATDFTLSQAGQQLKISSQSASLNAPLEAGFTNFKLSTLTGFVQPDSTLADGNINGKLTLIEFSSAPVFTGDLTVSDFRVRNDTVGNVHLMVNNKVSDTYHADITIQGRGNDVRLAGDYFPTNSNNNFDFVLDIRQMPLATAQAFSAGSIKDASGSVNGKFTVKGTMKDPSIGGALNFNKATFIVSEFNTYLSVDGEKLAVTEKGLQFNDFVIKDSSGNQLRINGTAATTNFSNYHFDLTVRANNFQALNSTKKQNKKLYGQLFFNTALNIKGTEELPVIDGRLVINEKTKLTIVLPQQEPGIVEREGVVAFVDKDAPLSDSLFMAEYDSLNKSGFTGMDISMIIEVNKEADLTMIIDEGNGDFLNVKGEALLTTSIDRSGKIILSGTYELQSGSYELSFNFLRRKFEIQKGSKITWEGEPTDALLNVTAKYIATVAPLDLVKNQLSENITTNQRNTYLQKLPFDVMLKMEDELLHPKITFDIILPTDKNYVVGPEIITNVRTRLDQLRQDEGEMNKQIFSLLLLNRFVAENPFASSSGSLSAATLARNSVSKLMTEQLNRLAADLVKGVDINFNVQSSEDYTTGERQDRTDLNVGLSKRLLNDRLTVTVGSNFELEGPENSTQQATNIAGDVALDYKLSSDGRYMLRGYRKNEYQGVIDGYIIETGVGFLITVDYNRFRQIFMSSKKRQKRQQRAYSADSGGQNQTQEKRAE